jgi:FlaA1/EpsC-like NDP-sugar epimerase
MAAARTRASGTGGDEQVEGGATGAATWEQRLAARATTLRGDWTLRLLDAVVMAACLGTMLLVRHGGEVPARYWHGYLLYLPVAIATFVAVQDGAGLYRRIWRYAGVDEARRLLVAGAGAMALLVAADLMLRRPVGLSVVVGAGLLTTMVAGTIRFQARLFSVRRARETTGLRLIMLGGGDTGASLLRQLRESTAGGITPVAILDDDPEKRGRTLLGVRVAGTFADLDEVARRTDAHQALLAVPSASAALVRRMTDLAEAAEVSLRILPDPAERAHVPYRMRDARAVAIEDLLGRQSVDTDNADLAEVLGDRVVMVTGGGGSIGSEVVRQLAQLSPRRLLVLDHDETHLHDVLSEFPDRLGGRLQSLLVDVRDEVMIREVVLHHRPDVVVHAAAHKHVPMLEEHPREAALTNVLGTRNLVAAASEADVENFVLISTDKAAHATSVMGASKWLAEQIVLGTARREGRRWCAVRFGNVLGSRGSVVPLFTRQISAGGPVTVTDPRMTRFFMTIPEAVHLVLRSTALRGCGDLFLLDMGQPVRIIDLAKRMVRLAGYRLGEDIEIRVTGARPGEQLTELLTTADEDTEPTAHRSIARVITPITGDLDATLEPVVRACGSDDQQAARHALLRAVSSGRTRDIDHSNHRGTRAWSLSTISGS